MSTPYFTSEIDTDSLQFGDKFEYNTRIRANITTSSGDDLMIQTPRMSAPFGVGDNARFAATDNDIRYNLNLSFLREEVNTGIASFHTWMEDFESKAIEVVAENSEKYFGKQKSAEVIEELFTSSIKQAKDPSNPDSFRASVYLTDSKSLNFEVYDSDKNLIENPTPESIPKGGEMTVIINCLGIYFMGNKWSIGWTVGQIVLHNKQKKKGGRIVGYSIRDSEEDNSNDQESDNENNDSNTVDNDNDVVEDD